VATQADLRQLPAVDQVLGALDHLQGRFPRALIVEEVRRVLDKAREVIRAGRHANPVAIEKRVENNLAKLETPSLRRVINATGVVLHTNLGRAPLRRSYRSRAIRTWNTTLPPAGAGRGTCTRRS
jgi:L-seryl-tRNA(Ser) seleniumtransferase